MTTIVKKSFPIQFPWKTQDPFLFCAYHRDHYPPGNTELGPSLSLEGRNLGQDFDMTEDWRMYHGTTVPGFPAHPHRGFETVTIAKSGLVDHADSLGAGGRFGNGDIQWMTAGKGVQHSEMFPLLNSEQDNPLELFQIWLNLPRDKKMTDPYYGMLWSEDIPVVKKSSSRGELAAEVTIIAGSFDGVQALPSNPDSWAANPENEVAIWTIELAPHTELNIPAANGPVNRSLFSYQGSGFEIMKDKFEPNKTVELDRGEFSIKNGDREGHFLFLQGKPINEPVVQYGPFVMNHEGEIREAMMDFQKTQFGGWPWPRHDHVFEPEQGRFAKYADGREVHRT